MNKKNKETFSWDEEEGIATCILRIESIKTPFIGKAFCNKNDADMKSKKTGEEIAFRRAEIKYLLYLKEVCENKKQVLHQLLFTINQSKKFNPNSYESHFIYKSYKRAEDDLQAMKNIIKEKKSSLKDWLNQKDEFYQKIRRMRKGS